MKKTESEAKIKSLITLKNSIKRLIIKVVDFVIKNFTIFLPRRKGRPQLYGGIGVPLEKTAESQNHKVDKVKE